MLGVNECSIATRFLGVRHSVKGDGGLTGGFGAVDLDDATARQPANTKGYVEGEGARGDHLNRGTRVIAEAHDGPFAELLVDLGECEFEGLIPLIALAVFSFSFARALTRCSCHGMSSQRFEPLRLTGDPVWERHPLSGATQRRYARP